MGYLAHANTLLYPLEFWKDKFTKVNLGSSPTHGNSLKQKKGNRAFSFHNYDTFEICLILTKHLVNNKIWKHLKELLINTLISQKINVWLNMVWNYSYIELTTKKVNVKCQLKSLNNARRAVETCEVPKTLQAKLSQKYIRKRGHFTSKQPVTG